MIKRIITNPVLGVCHGLGSVPTCISGLSGRTKWFECDATSVDSPDCATSLVCWIGHGTPVPGWRIGIDHDATWCAVDYCSTMTEFPGLVRLLGQQPLAGSSPSCFHPRLDPIRFRWNYAPYLCSHDGISAQQQLAPRRTRPEPQQLAARRWPHLQGTQPRSLRPERQSERCREPFLA